MRVGVYLAGFSPERGGGYTFQSEIFRALSNELPSSRHDFVALCESEEIARFAMVCGVRSSVLPGHSAAVRAREVLWRELPISRRLLRGLGRIERQARHERVDLIWYLDGGVYEAMDMPYIATVWDVMHRSHPWFPEVSSGGLWCRRDEATKAYLQRAAFVIVGTEAGADEVREFYQIPRERVRILPHPTPSFAFEPPVGDEKQRVATLGIDGPYLFYPAQFWPHKNHVNLLRALAHLREIGRTRIRLVLVGGDAGNLGYVKQLVGALQLEDQVSFPGFVSREVLTALYREAIALTYPSYCGPENLPPLEAFALDCPVIAADIPGAREQLGDACILVPPEDHVSMANAVLRIVEDPELRGNLIRRGRERATKWTAADFIQGFLSILGEFEPVRATWVP